jgi:hypothetical protein
MWPLLLAGSEIPIIPQEANRNRLFRHGKAFTVHRNSAETKGNLTPDIPYLRTLDSEVI